MYTYEKPIAELIDFNLERIMSDVDIGGDFSIEEGEEDA